MISACKKADPGPVNAGDPVNFAFWTDTDGYPIKIRVYTYGPILAGGTPVGILTTGIPGPVTDCSTPGVLNATLSTQGIGDGMVSPYRDVSVEPTGPYYGGQEKLISTPGFNAFGCNIVKVERDTALRMCTFWTAHTAYFNDNAELDIKISNISGKISKAFSADPGCGADSTFHLLMRPGIISAYEIYRHDTIIYSGTYTATGSACTMIEIP